jgi:hypothetical protein
MDHRCIHCHYLAKKFQQQGQTNIETVTRADRKKMMIQSCQLDAVDFFYCYKKVWDEGKDASIKDRVHNLLEKERRAQCFFYPYKPNMTFKVADHLQQNAPQPPAAGPSLLGDRGWLLWTVSAVVFAASVVYVLGLRH